MPDQLPRHILQRYREPEGYMDTYTMHANVDPGGSDEYAPVAMMRVMKDPPGNHYVVPSMMPGAHPAAAAAYHQQWNPAPGETLPMIKGGESFGHSISELYTTRSHRTVAPTMIGVAEATSRRETGNDIGGSSDLSPYSHQFVQHLASRGAIDPATVPEGPKNDIGFGTMEQKSAEWSKHGDLMSDMESSGSEDLTASGAHAEGRSIMRNVLRATRAPRVQHFEQGTLPI